MQPAAVEVLATHKLYDLPGMFGGWPSIARTPEGELLLVFSGDRKQHVDPYGKTLLVRSGDQGQNWQMRGILCGARDLVEIFSANRTWRNSRMAGCSDSCGSTARRWKNVSWCRLSARMAVTAGRGF